MREKKKRLKYLNGFIILFKWTESNYSDLTTKNNVNKKIVLFCNFNKRQTGTYWIFDSIGILKIENVWISVGNVIHV